MLCVSLLCGCVKISGGISAQTEFSRTIFAMDTEMSLKAYGMHSASAVNAAADEINRLDRLFDRGSEKSEVYRVNSNGSATVSEDTAELVTRSLEISQKTDGAFDISIAPIMDMWGFYTKEYKVPDEAELKKAMDSVGYDNISVADGVVSVANGAKTDLGGIAKGYLSDRIKEIFKENGVKSGIVSLGGNVYAIGTKPNGSKWRVAIQDPMNTKRYIGSVSVSDTAVITSGGYQRYFVENNVIYHHIIDPKTGYPANSGLLSVTIVGEDAALADGLSTALFVMGLEKGSDYWQAHDGFDVVFVTDDGKLHITEGLDGIFTSDRDYEIIKRDSISKIVNKAFADIDKPSKNIV